MIIRMCVVCRERLLQKDMLRFQCKNREVIPFLGTGRSFYICKECLESKNLAKNLAKISSKFQISRATK